MDGSRCSKCGSFSNSPTTGTFDISVAAGTRHHALLHTNEPPEDFETAFIHSVIAKIDARLQCVDDEISKLQEKLDQLEEERASLSCYLTRNKAILSPLRRIPAEVLGEIFSRMLPSLDDEWDRGRFSTEHSPWLLTHISSRWRAISISTPSLWSTLVIDFSTIHRDDLSCPYPPSLADLSSAYPLSLAETQFQRAQNLRIHFYGCETTDSHYQIQMFQLLLQHSSRWEELSLGLTSRLVPLLPAIRGRIPSLQRLWIQWFSAESQTVAESIDCFESAPSLVDFGAYNEFSFMPIAHPTHQLTRYELDCPWAEHKRILKLTPNLVEARVMILDAKPWPAVDEIINLPYLRRLYVSYTEALAYLRTPALEGLAFWVGKRDDLLPHLESFRDRSACSLRRLSLKGFPNAHTTIKILEKLPSITELAIAIDNSDASEGTNLLMSTLTVSHTPGSTMVAPQLRSFLLGCENGGKVDYTIFVNMLKSRWGVQKSALRNAALVTAWTGGKLYEWFLDLQALRRAGLDLLLLEGAQASKEMTAWVYSCLWSL